MILHFCTFYVEWIETKNYSKKKYLKFLLSFFKYKFKMFVCLAILKEDSDIFKVAVPFYK